MKTRKNWAQIGNSMLASAVGVAALGGSFLGAAGLVGGAVVGAAIGAASGAGIKRAGLTSHHIRSRDRAARRASTVIRRTDEKLNNVSC